MNHESVWTRADTIFVCCWMPLCVFSYVLYAHFPFWSGVLAAPATFCVLSQALAVTHAMFEHRARARAERKLRAARYLIEFALYSPEEAEFLTTTFMR